MSSSSPFRRVPLPNIELSALSLSAAPLSPSRTHTQTHTCQLLKRMPKPPQHEAQSRKELGRDEGEQQEEATKVMMLHRRGGTVGHAADALLLAAVALLRALVAGPGCSAQGLKRLVRKRRRPVGRCCCLHRFPGKWRRESKFERCGASLDSSPFFFNLDLVVAQKRSKRIFKDETSKSSKRNRIGKQTERNNRHTTKKLETISHSAERRGSNKKKGGESRKKNSKKNN